MRFSVNREDIIHAVMCVGKNAVYEDDLVGASLIIAEGDCVTFKTPDKDMIFERTDRLPAVVTAPGSIFVPFGHAAEAIERLPVGAQIEFYTEGDILHIDCGEQDFRLEIEDVKGCTPIEWEGFTHSFTMSQADMAGIALRTKLTMARCPPEYENGVLFHAVPNMDGVEVLRCSAIREYLLGYYDVPLPAAAAGMPCIFIPRGAVDEIYSSLREAEGEICVELSSEKARFTIGGTSIVVGVNVPKAPPNYQLFPPAPTDKILKVDNWEFYRAVGHVASIFKGIDELYQTVHLDVMNDIVQLTADHPCGTSAQKIIKAQYNPEHFRISLNTAFLQDILRNTETTDVEMHIKGPNDPVLIKSTAPGGAVYIMMPSVQGA